MSRILRQRGTDPDLFSRLKKGRICGRDTALAFPSLLAAALVCTAVNSESRQRDTLLEAKTLTEQASSLEDAGNYSRAEALGEALRIRESLLDPGDPEVAERLDALDAEGRYADGIPLEKRAIAIYQRKLGPEHPKLVALNVDLAELYEDEGDYRRPAQQERAGSAICDSLSLEERS